MKKVFLITKLTTTNIGNEALSNEIIKLFSENTTDTILNVNGRPLGLDGYYPKRIMNKPDPIKTFEKWTDSIVKKIQQRPSTVFQANIPKIKLFKTGVPNMTNERLKVKLRPLKRFLFSFLPYSKQYESRSAVLKNADWLIYSGAGEVGDNNVFLRQLIEIRVAQKLGVKTAAVNQSVTLKTEPFKKLLGHVYGKMQKIVIRGEVTKRNLISFGVDSNIIEVAPDSAINSKFSKAGNVIKKSNLVGFNITPWIKISEEDMTDFVNQLFSIGKKVIFITNEPFGDSNVARNFYNKFNIEFENDFANYQEYMDRLSECDFVISSRLHTTILSLVTHTPVIPIGCNILKADELLRQLEYPVSTINSDNKNWVKELVQQIKNVDEKKYNFAEYFKNILPIYQKKVERNAEWLDKM